MKLNLPIDTRLNEIQMLMKEHSCLVLTAEPGAGKTTRVPPALLEITKNEIWMLEPRRVAAIAAAERIALENNWQVGQEVGYQVKLDNKTSTNTKIKIVTEAILNRRISSDPQLKNIDLVILDEFHERSIHADLAIGLLKEAQILNRPDLKILVMSATLDAQKVSQFLENAPIVHVEGQVHPVEEIYQKENQVIINNRQQLVQIAQQIRRCFEQSKTQRTALAFLPGVPEIEFVRQELRDWFANHNYELQVLHGSLKLEEQREVLKSCTKARLILCTNIAETSLTIDGVDVVIDSGLAKVASLDARTGFNKLSTKRISLASAKQRQGRAGRQFAGKNFKLWNKMDEASMPAFEKPEIQRIELTETLLLLASLGQNNFAAFSWFDAPHATQLKQGWDLLHSLRAIDSSGSITSLGRQMAMMPLAPRLAKMVWVGQQINHMPMACELAAILQERDFVGDSSSAVSMNCESDVYFRWWLFHNERNSLPRHLSENIRRQSDQFKGLPLKKESDFRLNSKLNDELAVCKFLIFTAYSDRVCRRRSSKSESAIMFGKRGVKLQPTSLVKSSDFFVAIDGAESSAADTKVNLASAIELEWLEDYFNQEIQTLESVEFDVDNNKFLKSKVRALRGIPLANPSLQPCSPQELREQLPLVAVANWAYLCEQNQSLKRWLERYAYMNRQLELSDESLSEEQISSLVEMACLGEQSFQSLKEKDWAHFLESTLDSNLNQVMKNKIPDKICVPSGSWIHVNYPSDKSPYIEVRLQEIFGWTETPKVGPKEQSIVIHLLAPNFRPVQVTQDLKSFWQNAYPEVKRELKIKYPKHSWPDDPLNATPEAKGRRRQ